MKINVPRVALTVSAAITAALMLWVLPGDWRGLAVLPVFAWLAAWPSLGPNLGRHVDDFWEEEGTADPGGPPDPPAFTFSTEVPLELQRLSGPVGPPPSPDVDPVGYWQHRAWDDAPHFTDDDEPPLLPAPTPDTAGPASALLNDGGPGGQAPELEHTGGDQLAQLELEAGDPDLEHLAAQHAEAWRFAVLLERTRSSFDLLRRMHL